MFWLSVGIFQALPLRRSRRVRSAGVLRRVDEGSTGTQHDTQNVRLWEEALPHLVCLILPSLGRVSKMVRRAGASADLEMENGRFCENESIFPISASLGRLEGDGFWPFWAPGSGRRLSFPWTCPFPPCHDRRTPSPWSCAACVWARIRTLRYVLGRKKVVEAGPDMDSHH